MFNTEEAIKHAQQCYPNESVGVFVDNKYIPLENEHTQPLNDFKVSPEIYLKVGKIQAVVHSHPFRGDPVPRLYPSAADMRGQMDTAVPWGIICCDKERSWPVQWFGDQCPIPKYTERGFIHGIQDCYSLIRDYYRQEFGVLTKDFPRDWAWWNNGDQHLYERFFMDAGYRQIPMSQAKIGDVFLAILGRSAIKNNVVSHGGIYLGGDEILHHKSGDLPYDMTRLSNTECIHRYVKYIKYFLRHESQ